MVRSVWDSLRVFFCSKGWATLNPWSPGFASIATRKEEDVKVMHLGVTNQLWFLV